MSESPIASLHNYTGRFLRSTDLVRDFDDPHCLRNYWLTDFGRACLGRISDGFGSNSGKRAWRLTGDFGSGKSSFALLLAHSASDAENRLPKSLLYRVLEEFPRAKDLRYLPVLVTATRERMAPAILRAVFKAFLSLYSRRGLRSELELEIERLLAAPDKIKDAKVIELIEKTNRKIVQSGRASGMLLILDEVGKFLEFAAQNPDEQDVYFLQQLSEMATRSAKEPLVVVCLLHQGFNAYADQLAPTSQREWEKIAGRFEEIVFRQPLDQVALLIASAIKVDEQKLPIPLRRQAVAAFDVGVDHGWFGTSASRETLKSLSHRLFPIDPLLLPILVRAFQRFGQNERSLFSFLCSHEPFGLRAFSDKPLTKTSSPYRLADFYDYVRATFGHRLAVASYRTHWNVIESKIEIHPADKKMEVRILKTVAILNLLNADDLRPTRDLTSWAVAGNHEEGRREVSRLLKKLEGRDLHFRGETRGYSIWPYTSVDIDGRLDEAKRAIPSVGKVADAIRDQLSTRPIVARAHYIKTGNLRFFDVVYCDPAELSQKASDRSELQADGVILVPLCETKQESDAALQTAKSLVKRDDTVQIVAVPRPLGHLNHAALDALRWEWVQKNTPELNNDPYARDEVQIHLQEARNRLQSQIQEFIGLNRVGGRITISWFYGGEQVVHRTGRHAMRWLSSLCDEVFHGAPQISNELVNRHILSSAAAAARMRLIELMFEHADKPDLGIPPDRKPPEKSMYLSVLHSTGIHSAQDGKWQFCYPPANHLAKVRPALDRIRQLIVGRPDSRVSVDEIHTHLQAPPFGLRDGLFPLFLAVVIIVEERGIALYENGTFVRDVGPTTFLRMTKAPERFEVQYCKIEGVRTEVFERLLAIVDVQSVDGRTVELLDVVKTLCVFVAQLPAYVLNTQRLPLTAIGVRDTILNAREPVKLVFSDLPEACGFDPIVTHEGGAEVGLEFVKSLRTALDDLRNAYPEMQERMRAQLRGAFDLPGTFQQFRRALATRAEQILPGVAEPKLRAFCLRMLDDNLPEADWLESIGAFLALKPPAKWHDAEEDLFNNDLAVWGNRFHKVESIVFTAGNLPLNSVGVHLSVTQANGVAHERVIRYSTEEEQRMGEIQSKFERLLSEGGHLGLAAASRAILSRFEKTERASS